MTIANYLQPMFDRSDTLCHMAFEIEEDQVLDTIMRTRDTSDVTLISHTRAWGMEKR